MFISDFIFHTLKIITKSESHLLWSWVHSSSKIYIHTSVLKSTNIGRHLICNRYAANKAHMLQFDIVTTALINHHQNNTNQSDSLPECCNYFEVCKLRLHSLFRLYNFDEKVRNWCRITQYSNNPKLTMLLISLSSTTKKLLSDQLMQFPPTTAISRFV